MGMFSAKLTAESGNPLWAINQLERMDKLLPGKYYIKFFMGKCHLEMNNPSEGLQLLEEALLLEPGDEDTVSIYSYMGQCLKELERYVDAIDILNKAEEYDRERTDIYNLKGFCYFKIKDYDRAIDCSKNVLKLDPTSGIDYANIASNKRVRTNKEKA